jgi:hypothetical protein
MIENEDPKAALDDLRMILAAKLTEESEQARRYRKLANDCDRRVEKLTTAIVEADAAIDTIRARRV